MNRWDVNIMNLRLKTGVMAFKVKSDKESIRTLAYQTSQITTQCVKQNIKIIDCVITFGGVKDVLREVKKIDSKKRFDYLLVYSPNQIAGNKEDFMALTNILKDEFQVDVLILRQVRN